MIILNIPRKKARCYLLLISVGIFFGCILQFAMSGISQIYTYYFRSSFRDHAQFILIAKNKNQLQRQYFLLDEATKTLYPIVYAPVDLEPFTQKRVHVQVHTDTNSHGIVQQCPVVGRVIADKWCFIGKSFNEVIIDTISLAQPV